MPALTTSRSGLSRTKEATTAVAIWTPPPTATLTDIATFGGCTFSLDNAWQLFSGGSCSDTAGTLDLTQKNIVSLAPGVFANMPSLRFVCVSVRGFNMK